MTEATTPKASLVERIHSGEVGNANFVTIHSIAGDPATRAYILLLVLPLGLHAAHRWLKVLGNAGYGGSTIIATPNFPSAQAVIETGQIDAILMWDADLSKKRYVVDNAQRQAQEMGVYPVPLLVFDDPLFIEWVEKPLRDFMAHHCPL